MSRTLVGSALLLFAFAFPVASLRADDPGQPPLTKPVDPGPTSSPLPGTLTGGTLQLGNATSTTFSGTIANGPSTQGLTKTGGGILVLTGTNTYTGGTPVGGATGSTTLSGVLSVGSGGVATASGPVNDASNTYTGTTTISGGALFLSAVRRIGRTIGASSTQVVARRTISSAVSAAA